ncbi:MAG: NAD-dependent malic enzyme [Rhizobiales bacterium]|nr:NAD-dependent malic enzyme [Hyphomicrobiales bacterium]OJY45634.1 MAG: NAD-dependent malic enzyme [Rhizobiales bacterium 64-17]
MTLPPVPDFSGPIETDLSGGNLIRHHLFNKGTAFTEAERDTFRLHGLLPPNVGSLEGQVSRRLKVLRNFATNFERYAFIRDLQDTNETVFYALLTSHMEELLPIVYTPTVGEGCQRFSEIWRKPRGLFISYPNRHRMTEILNRPNLNDVRVIVVSDGERILGLGDQGAGGMGIPIGKLSLYTACAGIHPTQTLPILLDVGTDNQERLLDPLYIGWRHNRVRGQEYDDFIEEFVQAVMKRWPNVLLQWEDFAGANSGRLIDRYRDRLCTFNDDIQGTAAIAAGTLLAAVNVTGVPLTEQRIALFGAGSAGTGICSLIMQAMIDDGLSEAEARRRFYAVDRDGLLIEGMNNIHDGQRFLLRAREDVAGWTLRDANRINLIDVIENAKPTVLIGVSGQPGAFTEEIARAMAKNVARPVIFPLSNPTSRSEAIPQKLIEWTEGRALVGTGSPYPAATYQGRTIPIDQTNNSYIFPGVGLGVLAAAATRITDTMFMASAKALAALSPARTDRTARLLPPVKDLREVSAKVALAVGKQAQADGVAPACSAEELEARIRGFMWVPLYREYIRKPRRPR